jgi:CRISPR-associated protein Csx14
LRPTTKGVAPVSELRVCMDPLNPGQFFGCCGLFELIDLNEPGVLASFRLDAGRPRVAEFVVECSLHLQELLAPLKSAQPEFDETVPEASIRPATIPYGGRQIVLDWWLNEFRDKAVNLKCWAGQVTTRNLFCDLLPLIDAGASGEDIFERAHMSKAKFGLDPRSAWSALNFGFSPNEHGDDAATFPTVEILAAVGLQGFRPDADKREGVSYGVWQAPLPVAVARQAFRTPWPGLLHRRFAFSIAKRGQSYKYFTFGKESKDQ